MITETLPNDPSNDPLLSPATTEVKPIPPTTTEEKTDPLLDMPKTEKPKRKRTRKAAAPTPPEPEAPVVKQRTRARKAPEKRKPDSGWSRPKNFDEIKAKLKTKLRSIKEPIETSAIAETMGIDAKHVRWAFVELAKEKLCKVKLNKRRRAEVVAI